VRWTSVGEDGEAAITAGGTGGCGELVGKVPMSVWLLLLAITEGSGAVTCPPMEDVELAFAESLDMVPLFDTAIRERMALTIFMIPSIPSTSMSAGTVCERSSTSSVEGPYPAMFVQ